MENVTNFDVSVLEGGIDSSAPNDSIIAEPQDIADNQSADVDTGSSDTSALPTPGRDVSSTTVQDDSPYSEREKQLLARIEELSAREGTYQRTSSDDSTAFTPQNHNFLADIDIDDVLSTSEGLNNLLLSVYNKAIQEASRMSAENIMRGLPGTMSSYFNQQLTMRELVTNFYRDNPELEGMKKTVAMVANEVANENPELTAEQVFEETSKRARKLLGIADIQPKSNTVNGRERPTLHSSRGNGGRQRVQIPELDGLAREIHDLIT